MGYAELIEKLQNLPMDKYFEEDARHEMAARTLDETFEQHLAHYYGG